ncbi:hypothetical protein PO909_026813, partial [Leuciscus waleckii]
VKSSQVKFICIALLTIQIASKQLHSIKSKQYNKACFKRNSLIDKTKSNIPKISPTEQAKGNSGKEPKNSIK